MMSDMT